MCRRRTDVREHRTNERRLDDTHFASQESDDGDDELYEDCQTLDGTCGLTVLTDSIAQSSIQETCNSLTDS
jgi:hypothetical protein